MPGLLDFISLRDMIDGGGAGRSGQRFEGGPLSGLLNDLGIRPLGYNDRMDEAMPMGAVMPPPAPAMGPRPSPMSGPYAPGAVATTPLIGSMSIDQILEAIRRNSPPRVSALPDAPLPSLLDSLEMDRARMEAGSQPVPFGIPSPAAGPSDQGLSPEQIIARNLSARGVSLSPGELGALLPYLTRLPRVSQQIDFIEQYRRKNNMPPMSPFAQQAWELR